MRRASLPVMLLLAGSVSLPAQSADRVDIIPRPVSVVTGNGTFLLTARTTLWADRADSAVARRFARDVAPATGFDLAVRVGDATSGSRIVFRRAAANDTTLGPEGYRLVVTPAAITITSSAPAGAFYATQTVRQLLPAEVFRAAPIDGVHWTIPAVTIVDRPRFSWRGMHLDVSRHFMPKEFVKKYIDLLALHKMNSFHWHLTDDQGWRIEIKKYPRLTSVGAWRSQTLVGKAQRDSTLDVYDHKPHGGFYTQDDVREIVEYARERFVRIVPEIEMPGHSQAAIAAYPSLGNFRRHRAGVDEVGRHAAHPESVGYDDRLHAGRAHRSDGALPRRVHSHRRRRSHQAGMEGEPSRASQDQRARHRAGRLDQAARLPRRGRAAELVHDADGPLPHRARTTTRRLG